MSSSHKSLLSIIVPVFNEEEIVSSQLEGLLDSLRESKAHGLVTVIVCDGGSQDQTVSLAQKACNDYGWSFYSEKLPKASVGKTVKVGIDKSQTDYSMILPIDCHVTSVGWDNLIDTLQGDPEIDSGGFFKSYFPSGLFMKFYACVQNVLRTKMLRNVVWTNGIFAKTQLFKEFNFEQRGGFLEDVQLSDYLKGSKQHFIQESIRVSARLYYYKTPVLRVMINGVIMLLYRLRIFRAEQLKRLYYRFR